jgi:hypothetical protein
VPVVATDGAVLCALQVATSAGAVYLLHLSSNASLLSTPIKLTTGAVGFSATVSRYAAFGTAPRGSHTGHALATPESDTPLQKARTHTVHAASSAVCCALFSLMVVGCGVCAVSCVLCRALFSLILALVTYL